MSFTRMAIGFSTLPLACSLSSDNGSKPPPALMSKAQPSLKIEPFGTYRDLPRINEDFRLYANRKHKVYAMPSTAQVLENLLPELSKIAGQTIVIVEPLKFQEQSEKSFRAIPGIAEDPFRKISGEPTDPVEYQKKVNMDDMLGGNYSAYTSNDGKNSVCVLTGEISVAAEGILNDLTASVPSELKTEKYKSQFSDKKSILVLTMLHEAAHCSQRTNKQIKPSDYERNADSVAGREYKKLVARRWNLEPGMPDRFKELRRIKPFLAVITEPMTLMGHMYESHSIAGDDSSEDPAALIRKSTSFDLILKAAIYDSLSEPEKHKFYSEAERKVEFAFDIEIMKIKRNWSKYTLEEKGEAFPVLQIISSVKQPVIKLLAANLAQNQNPFLVRNALQALSMRIGNVDALCASIDASQTSRMMLRIWDDLHLKSGNIGRLELPANLESLTLLRDFEMLRSKAQSHFKSAKPCLTASR